MVFNYLFHDPHNSVTKRNKIMNYLTFRRDCGFQTGINHRASKARSTLIFAGLFICYFVVISCFGNTAQAADVERVTKEQLKEMIEQTNPVIIDVRIEKHWKNSVYKIKGAVRGNPKAYQSWSGIHPKTSVLVLYCAWPSEQTSARLAQKLMEDGYSKVCALKGGWNEWYNAEFPVEEKN